MKTRKTYEVVAVRSGKWWALEVVGLRMGLTQARRLSEVDMMVREVIAGLTDAPEDSFDITVRVDVPAAEFVAVADHLQAEAEEAKSAAETATRVAALALVASNIPVRDVATMLHVSPAWVSVLTKDREAV